MGMTLLQKSTSEKLEESGELVRFYFFGGGKKMFFGEKKGFA